MILRPIPQQQFFRSNMTKHRGIVSGNSVEKLDKPAQSPDLNASQHLRDDLESRQQAGPHQPTSQPRLTPVSEWEQNPCSQAPKYYQQTEELGDCGIDACVFFNCS